MERRLLTFVIASTAFFFAYILLLNTFGVKPNRDKANQAAAVDEDPNLVDGGDDPTTADAEPGETATPTETEDKPEETPAVVRPTKPSWVTLGSMDPSSNQVMMVTLNSRGGGVERIELTKRKADGGFKYRRVDVRNGYLGYFAGEPAETASGVLVNVVGPGTPAALATPTDNTVNENGIRPGDIIVRIGKKAITSLTDIEDALKDSKPGQSIEVEVLRGSKSGEETATGKTVVFNAQLTEHPLDLVRLAKFGGEDQIPANFSRLSCLLTLGQVNRKGITTGQSNIKGLEDLTSMIWNTATAEADGAESAIFDVQFSDAEMEKVGGEAVRVTRSYSLTPGSYVLDMSVQLENLGQKPQKLAYRLEGVNGVTMEGWWYSNKVTPNWSRAAARDIAYQTKDSGHVFLTGGNLVKKARKEPLDPDQGIFAETGVADSRDLKYIGIDAQYFDCAYIPVAGEASMPNFFRRAAAKIVADESLIEKYQEHGVNSSFYLDSVVGVVPPGKPMRHEFRMYAGPKEPELVEKYGLSDCVYYGWFSWFATKLVWILHKLYGMFGNYAVAIILLTVLVRGMMFPVSRKAAVNAQKMQELAPELKKIADKYKDDMEGRLKAQRELQRKVGFNPLAGCLPMLFQLPIFIGLYRALSVDIELRQAPFSTATTWASNLAGPDMFGRWDGWLMEWFSGRGTGWLGPYFNILPVIVVVLFITQQKMFMPPATDEQTAMTQKMMGFMTLFMGLFFFRVPAGLCLYFIASSLWGICERVLVKKTLPKGKHFDPDVIDVDLNDSEETKPEKKQSLADKLRDQIKPPEPPKVPPNKRKRPPGGKKNR